MSTKKPRKGHPLGKSSGRVEFDDRGNAKWEWHDVTGPSEDDIDTQRLETIGADLSVEGEHVPDSSLTHDPYNRPAHPGASQLGPKKRTLDDLRRLSEEIIASRRNKNRGQP